MAITRFITIADGSTVRAIGAAAVVGIGPDIGDVEVSEAMAVAVVEAAPEAVWQCGARAGVAVSHRESLAYSWSGLGSWVETPPHARNLAFAVGVRQTRPSSLPAPDLDQSLCPLITLVLNRNGWHCGRKLASRWFCVLFSPLLVVFTKPWNAAQAL